MLKPLPLRSALPRFNMMSTIESITFEERLPDIQKYWDLFQTTGWNAEYNFSPQDLNKAIQNSWYSISIYQGCNLVGFGRVISDGIHHP
jgi:hypothetical protein